WDFGDGSPQDTGYFVQHQYTALGIYTVTLYMEGECTGVIIDQSRTVDVFAVPGATGIAGNDQLMQQIDLYPNPTSDMVNINNKSTASLREIVVYNVLGQVVLKQKAKMPTQTRFSTKGLAGGLYNIRIETSEGAVMKKFEVMR
ncbi:MAG: T9SS type A sorting domain-containing protein, partial [Edaphocola sp.]